MTRPKTPTSFSLTDEARRLLRELAADLGLSQTGVLEMAIREFAKRHAKTP